MGRNKTPRRLLIATVIVLVLAGVVGYAYHKPLPSITITTDPPAAEALSPSPLSWPAYGEAAVGAIGYGVLTTHGPQTPLPTASTAKMMTALAVLHEKPLTEGNQGPTLTMTQADVNSYDKYVAEDGSVVPVHVGEQLSEYQALQAMLLPSANNMAETLARWAFGSIDAYTAYANQYAKDQGWTSMTITDPSGFLPTTVASASDLTQLGEVAMQNPVIAEIVAQPYANIPAVGTIYNVNVMLGHGNIIGIKTGNNDQDLGAYLFASQEVIGGKTITLVGAIMNAPSLPRAMSDSLPLIASAWGNFTPRTLLAAGKAVATYHVPWRGSVEAITTKRATAVLWKGDTPAVTIVPAKPHREQVQPNNAGVATITEPRSTRTQTIPLQLKSPIRGPSFWWRLEHLF